MNHMPPWKQKIYSKLFLDREPRPRPRSTAILSSRRDDDNTCVRVGVGSPDEAFRDQTGHTPVHARPRDERPGREVRHA
jgi:hypothetical protein